jgi:hypothetical protein
MYKGSLSTKDFMNKITLVRYGKPTQLDTASYGSECFVRYHGEEDYDLYVQTSKDSDNPNWDLIGSFTPKTSQDYINELISMRLGI